MPDGATIGRSWCSDAAAWARLGVRLAGACVRRLKSPLKLNFAVSYRCQSRCKTCNIWQIPPQQELTTSEIRSFIAQNRGISWLDVMGGELFLREDAEEILTAFAMEWEDLVLLHFATNGLLTERIAGIVARVAARRPRRLIVTVSLDGPEELNDQIRGVRGAYRRALATFKALRAISGVRAVLGMTLSRYNLGAVAATLRACECEVPSLEPRDLHVNVAQISGTYYHNSELQDVMPAPDLAGQAIDSWRRLRQRPRDPGDVLEGLYLSYLRAFLRSGRTPIPCHALRSSCFVDPIGDVYPCISYGVKLGNLRETGMDLRPVWESPPARTLQREIWTSQCPQCWTACEAYQSILGNALNPWRLRGPIIAEYKQPGSD